MKYNVHICVNIKNIIIIKKNKLIIKKILKCLLLKCFNKSFVKSFINRFIKHRNDRHSSLAKLLAFAKLQKGLGGINYFKLVCGELLESH